MKYVSRYKEKGGLSDLLKARHYLDLLIEQYEEIENVTKDTYVINGLAELEKKKQEKIAANKDWDAIVKACDHERRYDKEIFDIID